MSIALLCTSLLVGIFAWGLLLAGALSFNDTEKPTNCGIGTIVFFIDIFVSMGFFTMLFVIAKNWRRMPEARRLIYAGASCLAVAAGLGFIGFRIS